MAPTVPLAIRPANLQSAGEAATLLDLINRAFSVEKGDFKVMDRLTRAEFEEYAGRGEFLVGEVVGDALTSTKSNPEAEVSGSIAACVFVQVKGMERREGYIGLLSIEPALQGQGLGRAMTTAAEHWLCSQGCATAGLDTLDRRPELRIVYGKLGYDVVSVVPAPCPERFTKPVQFVHMRKALRDPGADGGC